MAIYIHTNVRRLRSAQVEGVCLLSAYNDVVGIEVLEFYTSVYALVYDLINLFARVADLGHFLEVALDDLAGC